MHTCVVSCAVHTPVSVNGALTGVAAATPTAATYMNNPGFDITQVVNFIVNFLDFAFFAGQWLSTWP